MLQNLGCSKNLARRMRRTRSERNKMKKASGISLAIILLFSLVLCGCGQKTSNTSDFSVTYSEILTTVDDQELKKEDIDKFVDNSIGSYIDKLETKDDIKRYEYEITKCEYYNYGSYLVTGNVRFYDQSNNEINPEGGNAPHSFTTSIKRDLDDSLVVDTDVYSEP